MQQAEFGHIGAEAAPGNGAVGEDGEAAGFLATGAEQADQSRVVDGRLRVRQGSDGGDAAGGGGECGGGDGFAVFAAGFAEFGAHIDQARAENGAVAIQGRHIRPAEIGPEIGDQAVAYQQGALAVEPARRVQQADIGDQQVSHCVSPGAREHPAPPCAPRRPFPPVP